MVHLPNITVTDRANIVANHALVSRKEDMIKYGYDENLILFKTYKGRVADPEDPENVAKAIETFWKCHSHGSASITKAKYPEMMQDKNTIKSTR